MNERYKESICPECGKVFYPEYLLKWGWKNPEGENVCSYSCQRKSENKPKKKRNPSRERIPVRIVETGEVFRSISDCASEFGTSNMSIHKCIYQGKAYKGLHIERVVG